jgi:predicted flap endonuclease-1-like 5' DNA nuclease
MTSRLISDVEWIGEATASRLFDAGIVYPEDLRDVPARDLLAIKGIGPAKAGRLCALDQDPEVIA